MYKFSITLALLALTLTGCGIPSDELSTNQIRMNVTVTGENNQTSVSVELQKRNVPKFHEDDVVLTGGDRLIANIDGQPIKLRYIDQTFPEYIGVFEGNGEAAEVKVTLDRPAHDNAATEVTMPRPLYITAPATGESFGIADMFSISWNPIDAEDSLNLRFKLECDRENVNSRSSFSDWVRVEDTGFYSIPVLEIIQGSFQGEPAIGSVCDGEIQLDYFTEGEFIGDCLLYTSDAADE